VDKLCVKFMCIVMYTHDILKAFSVLKLHINLYIYMSLC